MSTPTELEPPHKPTRPRAEAPAQIWSLIRFVLRRTFADPVREGRLDPGGWPPGLRSIAGAALVVYALLMMAAVFGSVVRGHSRLLFLPPNQTLPAPAVPLICVAMIMALTCLFTAGLHLRVPLRLAVVVVTMAVLLYPLDWSDGQAVNWVSGGLAALLPVIVAWRWRRRFHWLEFVISLLVIGHAVIVHQVFGLAYLSAASPGLQVAELNRLALPLGALAAPAALLAGAALVEITTSAATWTVTGAWQRLGGARRRGWPWTTVVLAALILGRVAQEVQRMSSRSEPVRLSQLAVSAALATAVGVACAIATGLADRRPTGDPGRRPDPDELLPTWSRCTPVLAIAVAAVIGGTLLISIVFRAFGWAAAGRWVNGGDNTTTVVLAVTSSAVALLTAVLLSLRGWRKASLLLMSFGTMYGASTLLDHIDLLATTDDMLVAVSAAAVLVLGWLAVRRRLTPQAQVSLAGVLLLNLGYHYRDWFTEPLTQLVSLTGVSAALLVGLVWRILTDNAYTRGDSTGFPQPSRVLIALGNAVVGVTFAAQVALLGGRFDLDLGQVERAGDIFLGFPLVLAVSFAGLSLAAGGRAAGQRSGWARQPRPVRP